MLIYILVTFAVSSIGCAPPKGITPSVFLSSFSEHYFILIDEGPSLPFL